MHEMVPILIGVGVMLACNRIALPTLRACVLAALVVCGAAAASLINGEYRPWPLFVIADVCFVLAGVALVPLCRLTRRRPSSTGVDVATEVRL